MKKVREGYKITELGEIPNEWEISSLSNITSLITKGTTPMTYGFAFEEDGINFIKVENINEAGFLNKSSLLKISDECNNKLSRSQIQENDILMSIAGTLGRTTIISKDVVPANTNQALAIIRVKGQNNISYINKALSSDYIKNHINMIGTVGAQPNLSLKQVGDLKILIPPIKEQEKIASILSTVDEQIDNVNELIQKNKELKKGLMQQLLTKGIGHTKFKKTEIGEIPEEWEVKQLGDIAQYINGKAFKPSEWSTQGLPIVRIQNLNGVSEYNYYNGELDEKFIINDGQLLFSWSGSKGTSFGPYIWNNGKAVLNQHIFKVDLKEDVNKIYSYYALKHVTQIIEESAHGSAGLVHVTKGVLEKFKIGVPEIEEQKKISYILSKVDKKIELNENKKQKLEELKKGLMQQLLSGKIKVV